MDSFIQCLASIGAVKLMMGRQNGGGRQGTRIRTGQRGGRQDQCQGRRRLLIDKKVFLNGDVLTSLIEASLDDLDDYEKETALASFPADSDGQNESRLLVEDGVSCEVVVP